MRNDILPDVTLPSYVFTNRYKHYQFIFFDDFISDKISLYFNVIFEFMKKQTSRDLYMYERYNNDIFEEANFNIFKNTPSDIYSAIMKRDEHDLPYFYLIAMKIVFAVDNGSFCIYADRGHDLVIIGSQEPVFNESKEFYMNQNIHLIDIETYTEAIRQLIPDENKFKERLKLFQQNYSSLLS